MRGVWVVLLMVLAGPVAAEPFKVDHQGSRLGFAVDVGSDVIEASFQNWRAEIWFDPHQLERSRIAVTIDLDSARTGSETVDAILADRDWFDLAAFPQAEFRSHEITTTANGYLARGKLRLKGVEVPLVLDFVLADAGDGAKIAQAEAEAMRLDFGIGARSDPDQAQVGNRVRISAEVLARPASR